MRYVFTILALIFVLCASAQETLPNSVSEPINDTIQSVVEPRKSLKERLSQPVQIDSLTTINETVHITEQGDAAVIVQSAIDVAPKSVSGYRIVIFMSNSQTARRDAVTAQENFIELFPQEQSYLSYENPYFKVAVGNCTTQEEAIILLGRLRSTFPKAFIMRESIDTVEFTR